MKPLNHVYSFNHTDTSIDILIESEIMSYIKCSDNSFVFIHTKRNSFVENNIKTKYPKHENCIINWKFQNDMFSRHYLWIHFFILNTYTNYQIFSEVIENLYQ